MMTNQQIDPLASVPSSDLQVRIAKFFVNAILFSALALPLNYFFGDWIRTNIYQPVLSFFFGVS